MERYRKYRCWFRNGCSVVFFLFTGLFVAYPQPSTTFSSSRDLISLWQYSTYHFVSDRGAASVNAFFDSIGQQAARANNQQLKAYAQYFRYCSLILFSIDYEQHYGVGNYKPVIKIFADAGDWATHNGHPDIAASAEHYIGQVYFRVGLYGQAFEHLLKADAMMQQEGYGNIPAASVYLYELGLDYYRFEDLDKALQCFLEAIRHPVYLPRNEMNSLNAIGLIYAKRKQYGKALAYYQQTLDRAREYNDIAWIGIASGNIGSVYLAQEQPDLALPYYRQNYLLNATKTDGQNDAALTAIYMAKAFARQHKTDSAFTYLEKGYQLGLNSAADTTERFHFYRSYLEAGIEANKQKGNLVQALRLADSLLVLNDSIKQRLDSRFLSRAVQKTQAEKNAAELQLLESHRKLSQLRLLLVIVGLLVIITIILLFFKNYRRQRAAQERVIEKERQLLQLEKLRIEEKLSNAGEQLDTYLQTIREKNEYIRLLANEMSVLKETGVKETQNSVMESLLSNTILTDDDWRRFRGLFEQVYPGFTARLAEKFPNLSPAETRLLILSRLDLTSREMANMLGISVDAIRKLRYRLRKKINLSEEADLGAIVKEL